MKVSVIIPVYNAAKYLPVCLESLAIQSMHDFEIIVVDDCSTDSSVAVAESYLERFGGRLKIIMLDRNTGSGAVPRNIGLEHARGEYVFFADADDLLIDNALEIFCNFAQEYRADVVYTEAGYLCGEEPIPAELTETFWNPPSFAHEEPTFETDDLVKRVENFMNFAFALTPWTKFVRRNLLTANKITFSHMTIAEDVIWTFKIICRAKKFLRVPTLLYVNRRHDTSTKNRLRKLQDDLKFWTSPLIHGLDLLDEFMRGIELFKQKPNLRLQVLNFFAGLIFGYIKDAMKSLDATEAYEIFLREFSVAGSSQPALIAYLLLMNNLYRNELTK